MTTIQFALSMTHVKCNDRKVLIDLLLPSADTVVHNSRVLFNKQHTICNNNIVAWFVANGILFACDSLYQFHAYFSSSFFFFFICSFTYRHFYLK